MLAANVIAGPGGIGRHRGFGPGFDHRGIGGGIGDRRNVVTVLASVGEKKNAEVNIMTCIDQFSEMLSVWSARAKRRSWQQWLRAETQAADRMVQSATVHMNQVRTLHAVLTARYLMREAQHRQRRRCYASGFHSKSCCEKPESGRRAAICS